MNDNQKDIILKRVPVHNLDNPWKPYWKGVLKGNSRIAYGDAVTNIPSGENVPYQ